MATFVGQHDLPWLVISAAMAYSGNVPSEYLLTSTVNSAFLVGDITFRVLSRCEEQGIAKSAVFPAIPIYAILGGLSFLAYQKM